MEKTFYVVNEIYTHENDNYDDSVILNYYTQDINEFFRYVKNTLGKDITDFDSGYYYLEGYEMFEANENELLEYIYEYPINFTDKIRDSFKTKEDVNYDMTISNYFCLIRNKLKYITSVKQGMNYDLIDTDNGIFIECEQGYFLNYLVHFIEDKYFDRGKLIKAFLESYIK